MDMAPDELRSRVSMHKKQQVELLKKSKEVTFTMFFTNKKSALCIFTCFMACVCLLYFGPILTPALVLMGMSDATAGYGVATCWAVYAVACPFAGKAC